MRAFTNALFIVATLVLGGCEKLQPSTPSNSSPGQPRKGGPEREFADLGLSKEDTKAFAGSDRLTPGGKVAEIKVLPSEDEKRFIADFSCWDERECYGFYKFDKYIGTKYPEIAKVKFRPPKEISNDKDALAFTRLDFRRGLYFAKEIRLADGTTLFDLLTKCSKDVSPLNWAEMAWADPAHGFNQVHMVLQYFPVLRQKGTGKEFEVNILLDRYDDRVRARSPFFSTSMLEHQDFMDRHGLECWQRQ